MALSLTKSNLKSLIYGTEIGFSRGIRGRKNIDGDSVMLLLQKKMPGHKSPVRVKLGTWPDNDIDALEQKARECRALIEQGIHPYAYHSELQDKKKQDDAEKLKRNATLDMMLTRFEKHKIAIGGRGIAISTVKDRRSYISRYFKEYMNQPIGNISKQYLTEYLNHNTQIGKRNSAIKAMKYLRSVMNYAIDVEDVITINPVNVFKGFVSKSSGTDKIYLRPQECTDLLENIHMLCDRQISSVMLKEGKINITPNDVTPNRSVQYHAISMLLLSGVRLQEMLKLEWKNVYMDETDWRSTGASGPFFQVSQYKIGGTPFGVPITPFMEYPLRALKELRVGRYVFPSSRPGDRVEAPTASLRGAFRTLDRMMPSLGDKLGANLCRKTFATTANRLHYTLDQIDRLTGHMGRLDSRNVATNVYIANSADDNRDMFVAINIAQLGIEDLEYRVDEPTETDLDDRLDFGIVEGVHVQDTKS